MPSEILKLDKIATKLISEKRIQKVYREMVQLKPETIEEYIAVQDAWEYLGEVKRAIDCINQGLSKYPDSFLLQNENILNECFSGSPQKAREMFNNLAKPTLTHKTKYEYLDIFIMTKEGNTEEAIERLAKVIEKTPSESAVELLCQQLDVADRPEQRYQTLKKYAESLNSAILLCDLAIEQHEAFEDDAAFETMRRVLKIDNRRSEYHYYMALFAAELGKSEIYTEALWNAKQCEDHYDFVERVGKGDAYMLIGLIGQNTKEYEKAMTALEKIMPVNEAMLEGIAQNYAWLCDDSGSYQRGINFINETLKKVKAKDRLLYEKGRLLAKQNKHGEAINCFKSTRLFKEKNPKFLTEVGWSQVSLKDYEGAIKTFTEAIESDKPTPDLFNGRSKAYKGLKKYEQARDDRDMAAGLDPLYYSKPYYHTYTRQKELIREYDQLISLIKSKS